MALLEIDNEGVIEPDADELQEMEDIEDVEVNIKHFYN